VTAAGAFVADEALSTGSSSPLTILTGLERGADEAVSTSRS
jgi:hypothetical protein